MRWESASGGGGCAGGWAAPGGGVGQAARHSALVRGNPMTAVRPAAARLGRAHLLPPGRRGAHSMGMVAPSYFTAEQVRALPDDGNRYEVVYGELLVTPAPRPWHQSRRAPARPALGHYLGGSRWASSSVARRHLLGSRRAGPAGRVRGRRRGGADADWSRMRTLLLVAEVLSPSTARADRFSSARYREAGVSAVLGGGRRRPVGGGLDAVRRLSRGRARNAALASRRRQRAVHGESGRAVPAALIVAVTGPTPLAWRAPAAS